MEIKLEELDDDIIHVSLSGRMDIMGTSAIDLKFSAVTNGDHQKVLVDMSEVSFIASIGMRTLLSSAKSATQKGNKIVLANCQPLVQEALETAGIDTLIPMFESIEAAKTTLNA